MTPTDSAAEYWSAAECAAGLRHPIGPSTWRDYVADGRAPAALDTRDPQTGRLRWDAGEVRAWDAARPGQGVRTDLPAMPAVVAELAALLCELVPDHGLVIRRGVIRAEWLAMYPEDGSTAMVPAAAVARRAARQGPRGDGRPHTAGKAVRKRVGTALAVLERAGVVRRQTGEVEVLDLARLTEMAR